MPKPAPVFLVFELLLLRGASPLTAAAGYMAYMPPPTVSAIA